MKSGQVRGVIFQGLPGRFLMPVALYIYGSTYPGD